MESKFITSLKAESLDDGTWRVLEPLCYASTEFRGLIEVPAGWITDLASVPRVPLVYMAFGNRAHHESVIHDYLFGTHLTTRARADAIFLEAMIVRGKPLWIRKCMYWGVRIGGASSYRTGPERAAKLNQVGT